MLKRKSLLRRNRRTRSIIYTVKFDPDVIPDPGAEGLDGVVFVGYKVPDKRTHRIKENYTRLVICDTHKFCVACIGTDEKELVSYPDLFCPKCGEITSGAGIRLEEV